MGTRMVYLCHPLQVHDDPGQAARSYLDGPAQMVMKDDIPVALRVETNWGYFWVPLSNVAAVRADDAMHFPA